MAFFVRLTLNIFLISSFSGRKRRGSETLSDSSDEGELDYSPWSSSSERAATPVMSECTAAMVLMNLSHAQLAAASAAAAASASSSSSTTSKEQHQQRMMQFLQHDTQNCPQGMSTFLSTYLPIIPKCITRFCRCIVIFIISKY